MLAFRCSLLILHCTGATLACQAPPDAQRAPPYPSAVAHLVDPFIGTAGEGYTFPGAVAPWGLVSLSPHTTYASAKDFLLGRTLAPAGYVHGAPAIRGFGLTHLSGVGCPDLGAPVLAATLGLPDRFDADGYRTAYRDEVAWPGYYAVELVDSGIRVEATARERSGTLRVRFPQSREATVIVDAGLSLSWRGTRGTVRVVSSTEVEGSSETGLFCMQANVQTVYFVARFDRPARAHGTFRDGRSSTLSVQGPGSVGAYHTFEASDGEAVEVRFGLSYVSTANARRNLEAELPNGVDFEAARARTYADWDAALGRIRVSGGTRAERTQFYTALYHSLLHPNVLSDVNGEHPTMGRGGVGVATGEPRYTVFSLWDTYRTVHPLLALAYPERQRAMLRSIAAMTAESGRPPLWELVSSEANMMVGDPAAIVVLDSLAKGIAGVDLDTLYGRLRSAALDVAAATPHRPGNASYLSLGYVPMDEAQQVWGPVSTTLEYALADWALSGLAARLGRADEAARFAAQARAYVKLFDPQSGLLRPRWRDGRWYSPFDPSALQGSRPFRNTGGPGYVEGTAYHYAFFVPHDLSGLAKLHGGAAQLVQRLQRVFDEDRFVMWNEPDIAYPYLFTHFQGEAHRTQREVARARARFFGAKPDGLPGNDDAGTLSAWYVFSAMGFYPDCPGSTRYSLASPLFDRIEIALHPGYHSGRRFVIEARRSSPSQIHVAGMTLDDRPYTLPYLTHEQIAAGGTLRLTLADSP